MHVAPQLVGLFLKSCQRDVCYRCKGFPKDASANFPNLFGVREEGSEKDKWFAVVIAGPAGGRVKMGKNSLKQIRESFLMSKAELARKAGVSPITIDRIEKGKGCRMETKRKILLALNYRLSDKNKVFSD